MSGGRKRIAYLCSSSEVFIFMSDRLRICFFSPRYQDVTLKLMCILNHLCISTRVYSKNFIFFFPQGTEKAYFKVKIHSTIFLVMPNFVNYFRSSNKEFMKETMGPYKMAYNNISRI